nr:immunoglobulin light chain junction region [Macaca mulatta]MOX28066.1 immunoglobulin light chain junction region [Macaca mulatta]MOX29775.1 immunoglobulin light chain junction region [Macaca mulatta]MOX30683.1 immunoglobulin light chain junction region [Macaca mulatta]MOX31979.1 immunoglobulin light chain junction region [Macaca mulatta]
DYYCAIWYSSAWVF